MSLVWQLGKDPSFDSYLDQQIEEHMRDELLEQFPDDDKEEEEEEEYMTDKQWEEIARSWGN